MIAPHPAGRRALLASMGLLAAAPWLAGCARPRVNDVADMVDKPTSAIFLDEERALLPRGEALRALHAKGLQLTKISEGWINRRYNDAAGYCTIGYGHLCYKRRCDDGTPAEFIKGITESEGTALLQRDMERAQVALQLAVADHATRLNDVQYAALCDFVFNVGGANFRESTLLKVVLVNEFDRVPSQLRRWTLAGGKTFEGLRVRREREIALFFDGQAIPKSVPRRDDDLSALDIVRP